MRPDARVLLFIAPALIAACSAAPPPVADPNVTPVPTATAAAVASTTAPAAPTSAPAAGPAPEQAHRVAMLAAACWIGGLWGDALGEAPEARKAGDEARCHEAVKRIYGGDDPGHYERLRAIEPGEVDHVVLAIEGLAKNDPDDGPRSDALAKITRALAGAQRENLEARRAADRVKHDLAGDKEPAKLTKDEGDAAIIMLKHEALTQLLKLDAGALTGEARALGVLSAMERMELARGLPRHLKIFAVSDSFSLVLGAPTPDLPDDGTKKLKPGAWVTYVTAVAAAAGHEVPATAKTPKERERLGWGGVLEGFADKLGASASAIGPNTDLAKVVPFVQGRLHAEYTQAKAYVDPAADPKKTDSKKAPAPKK